MKKITVTEDNFLSILERLQKICSKYRMLKFYRVYDENMKEMKQFRNNAIKIRENIAVDRTSKENYKIKKTKKLDWFNEFVLVNKHPFREEFEQGKFKNSFVEKVYLSNPIVIHISLYGGGALTLSLLDKIQFLPFGGGFIIWDYDRFENLPETFYKYIFIPDYIAGKISSSDEEINKRNKECEEEEMRMVNNIENE